jgi:homocysteine S-methyltransferase
VPVLASFVLNDRGETAVGMKAGSIAQALDADENVDAVGINCGTGPAGVFDALQSVLPLVEKPVVVMPNAGFPRDVGGRLLYLTSPEYFTEYAKKYIELGVRGVGGCCGTTPSHIRVAGRAIKSLSGVKRHVEVRPVAQQGILVQVVPPEKKSKLSRKIMSGEKVTSVEIPPPRSSDLSGMLSKVRKCAEAGVDAINIPDGPRASARISPMIAAITILREVGIEPILHYCCRDRNLIGMQSDLLGGYAAGLRNFLIITGDPPKVGDYPQATGVFDVDAIGLTQVAANRPVSSSASARTRAPWKWTGRSTAISARSTRAPSSPSPSRSSTWRPCFNSWTVWRGIRGASPSSRESGRWSATKTPNS